MRVVMRQVGVVRVRAVLAKMIVINGLDLLQVTD